MTKNQRTKHTSKNSAWGPVEKMWLCNEGTMRRSLGLTHSLSFEFLYVKFQQPKGMVNSNKGDMLHICCQDQQKCLKSCFLWERPVLSVCRHDTLCFFLGLQSFWAAHWVEKIQVVRWSGSLQGKARWLYYTKQYNSIIILSVITAFLSV